VTPAAAPRYIEPVAGLRWLEPPRPSDGPRVGAFCFEHVRQTKGRWAGQPLEFEAWQQVFLNEAFELDPATGLRVYSEVLLGIPRKNGKSTMAAGVSLYLLAGDGEAGPEVLNAAGARDQARVVFSQARSFVEASPTLPDILVVQRSEILCPSNDGHLRVIASDAKLQHGSNPSGSIIDELWAHATDDLYMALTTGTAAREQPFTLTCTTAGFDEESPLGRLYGRALKLEVEHPSPYLTIARDRANGFLMYWYAVPASSKYDATDPRVVKGANPASWVTVAYLRKERHKPAMRLVEYQRWHANQWTASEDAWVDAALWDACIDELDKAGKPRHPLSTALPVGAAVDMGEVYDSTGRVVAQRQACWHADHAPAECLGPMYVVRGRRWANPYPPGHTLRPAWRVSTEEVREDLRELRSTFPLAQAKRDRRAMAGPAVAYDPWHFRESAEMLEEEGLHMVEFPQFASRMGPASEQLLELVKQRRLVHDGDPDLRAAVLAAIAKRTRRGWVIDKPKGSTKLIDLLVACAMAVQMAMLEPPPPPKPKRRVQGF
jgi:phage terminase large subunit-like protein